MKTKMKTFLAVLIVIIAIICQEYVRRSCGINPQIWIFVVYAMAMAGFYLILHAFENELDEEKAKKWEERKFISLEEERNKVKRVLIKIRERYIYYIVTGFAPCAIIYSTFFPTYFWKTKFMGIIYILYAISCFITILVLKRKIDKLQFCFWELIGICGAVVNLFC